MSHQLIVAIGRESGSGGLDIAHALAERLQLPLFDKSILQKAAEDKGVSAETLERYDERPYSPLFCRSVRGISSAPEDCVAQMQFELLRQHADAGESFVVLGRCAEEVLADQEGWDRYEAAKWLTMRRWLAANPGDDLAAEVRELLTSEPGRYVTYTREYLGWGVFALMMR